MNREVKEFLRQQAFCFKHHKPLMSEKKSIRLQLFLTLLFLSVVFLGASCISPKEKIDRPKLLKGENAAQELLLGEVNRFARVNSMRAKMDLKFEDNSFAESGIAEKYKTADGEVVVQRPANILLKVQIPIIKTDVAQMTSNGNKFCVAILEDGAGGKYKKFVCGTNTADYTILQKEVDKIENGDAKTLKQNVNAFANLRPQHFTEAMLLRPVDTSGNIYVQSEIFQEEFDINAQKKSPLRWVLRPYYLLDEIRRTEDGTMKISRRFWFDRVGGIRLARQQIFDASGAVESDIVYGREGDLTENPDYKKLPLRIEVTRPKEKYKMSLTYQDPTGVSIGKTYPLAAFELKNTWNLPEVDLDKKLQEVKTQQTQAETTPNLPRAQ
jgi:hypothetical protein